MSSSLKHNQSHLVYALDDPYIHMAIAKNFATDGVWGVTKYHFNNSSSAPLWTLLISVFYFLFGVGEAIPFILNLAASVALIFAAFSLLKRFQAAGFYIFLVLLAIIFFTPLPTLIFSGQEHILHALLTILFAHFASQELSSESGPAKNRRLWLLILAPALTSIRYEGLFLTALVCFLFLLRKRWLFSILLGVLALFPPVLNGVILISKGWFFFPNPIILKSMLVWLPGEKNVFGLIRLLARGTYNMLLFTPHIYLLLVSALLLYFFHWRQKESFWNQGQLFVLLFIGTAMMHVTFANTGWFFRYEAYLIAFGLSAASAAIFDLLSKPAPQAQTKKKPVFRYAVILLSLLLISVLARRGFFALQQTRPATTNIYEQQYQMGLFLKEFYTGSNVAANDIGAINFLADIDCLDLWGLGSMEPAILRFADRHGPEELDVLTRPADVIVVYEQSFAEIMPARWIKAGQWTISNNVVAAYDSVAFFAPDSAKAVRLMENLRVFSPRLPKTVLQSGKYLDYIPK